MRTTAEEVAQQKVKIIESALKVFSEKGYSRTKMSDIALVANISRGPLYYHYKDKKTIFVETLKYDVNQLEDTVRSIYTSDYDIFEKISRECKEVTNCRIGRQKLLNSLFNDNGDLKEARDFYNDFITRLSEMKKAVIKEEMKKGNLREDCDPDVMVDMIYVLYSGTLGQALFESEQRGLNREELVKKQEKMIDEFVNSLRTYYVR